MVWMYTECKKPNKQKTTQDSWSEDSANDLE